MITSEEYPVITSDMLRYFYEHNEVLTVYGSGYTMKIDGEKIKNWENELYTGLVLKDELQGISFELNRSKRLCGAVTIQFDEETVSGNYLYLYNVSKGQYELLQQKDINLMELDTEGRYLITETKLSAGKVKIVFLIIMSAFIIVLLGVYIVLKKRYWFW